MVNGARAFAASLKAHGVDWVATLCGHGLNEIYAALLAEGIRLVDVRNEQTAAYMAESWGRLTGRPGVCAVSSGVAHANGMSGVVNAHFDGAPMLLISGCGPLETATTGHFQDLDQVALAAPVCKYNRILARPEGIGQLLAEAFAIARCARPGPVHLAFPMDVQTAAVDGGPQPVASLGRTLAPAAPIEQAVQLLAGARRPLVLAGSGVHYGGAGGALAKFTAAFHLPVAVPIWDRGTWDGGDDSYLGVVGAASGGPPFLQEADLLLVLGAAADYRVGYLKPPGIAADARVVRVDADPGQLARGAVADLAIAADVGGVVGQLHRGCSERQLAGFAPWLARTRELRQDFERRVRQSERGGRMHALDLIEALEQTLDPTAAVVVDGGNIGQWFHQTMARRRYPAHWLSCGASGVVGYGLAGAMAARLAFPQRQVVLLSGDGSATFTIAELECAVRQQLPFVMLVADDQSWGITASGHQSRYGRTMSSTLGPVDFAAVARGFGARGVRAEDPGQLSRLLLQALDQDKPTLIHAPICGGLPAVGD